MHAPSSLYLPRQITLVKGLSVGGGWLGWVKWFFMVNVGGGPPTNQHDGAQNMNWNNRIEAFAMHTSPVRPLERFLHNSSRRRGGGLHSYTITIQHSAMDYYYYCCSTSFPHVRWWWWWWYLPRASRTRKSPILHYCGGGVGGWRSDSSWWRTVVHGQEWITWVEIGKYKYGMPRRGALLFLLPLTEWVSEWVMLCIAMVAKVGGSREKGRIWMCIRKFFPRGNAIPRTFSQSVSASSRSIILHTLSTYYTLC